MVRELTPTSAARAYPAVRRVTLLPVPVIESRPGKQSSFPRAVVGMYETTVRLCESLGGVHTKPSGCSGRALADEYSWLYPRERVRHVSPPRVVGRVRAAVLLHVP